MINSDILHFIRNNTVVVERKSKVFYVNNQLLQLDILHYQYNIV